jgi:enediyne biosynthesis protein E4
VQNESGFVDDCALQTEQFESLDSLGKALQPFSLTTMDRRRFLAASALAAAATRLHAHGAGAAIPPILFENIAERAGVHFIMENCPTPEKHQPETMPAGVALFDYDGNGLLDIYLVNGAEMPSLAKTGPKYWNRLFRNNGDGTFTDVTVRAGVAGAGYGMGVAAGDYDNDGRCDLFLANVNGNQLLHNNGDGTFTDVTAKAGLSGAMYNGRKVWSIAAGWFDYNNDGLLDLFVVNYVQWDPRYEPSCMGLNGRGYCHPNSFAPLPNTLYRNNADGR